jgi:hypothetical protein
MREKRLPKSLRKFIRKEKARIRREFSDLDQQKKSISEIYEKLIKSHVDKRDLQPSNK